MFNQAFIKMRHIIRDKILLKRRKNIFLHSIIIILIFILILLVEIDFNKNTTSNKDSFNISPYLRIKIYPWQKYYSTLNNFLLKYEKVKLPQLPKELSEKDNKPGESEIENQPLNYSAYFTVSLTSSPGSLSIYGVASGIDVFLNGEKLNKDSSGKFSGGVGSNFTLLFKGYDFERKVTVNSPAYGTNFILERLSVTIDPVNLVATLKGRVNLNLPGEIKGTFFNASNGGADGTVLKNGNFTVAVPLSIGVNNLTASGSWLTIRLDLPTIVVKVE